MLARHEITGPVEVFEGNKGFMDAIAGRFEIDWSREDLEKVTETSIKRYNAEFHSGPRWRPCWSSGPSTGSAADVDHVQVDVFDVAFNIIAGGEEGDKKVVRTKEQADHSLPYLVAVALLDGQVLPAQFAPQRIARADVHGTRPRRRRQGCADRDRPAASLR